MIYCILMLPFNIAKNAFNFLSKKLTFTYSSAPVPKEGFKWGNIKTKALVCFLPAVGEMLCGIVSI